MTEALGPIRLDRQVFERSDFLRHAEEASFRSDTDFRQILDLIPAAVYITNAAGQITYYNEAAAAMWGHHPQIGVSEWCGLWKLYWPDGRPRLTDRSRARLCGNRSATDVSVTR
jgi:PAS domain-containing protein